MNQFLLKPPSTELLPFLHIVEFALYKNTTVIFNSLKSETTAALRFYYINEGKFDWVVDDENYTLLPGDVALIMPGQSLGGHKQLLNIGTITWLHLQVSEYIPGGTFVPGGWSGLTQNESNGIGKIFCFSQSPTLSNVPEAGHLLLRLKKELINQETGYVTSVNHLLDELLILAARQMSQQNNSRRDFPQSFFLLEQNLRNDLGYQWTVEEMGALVGLGNTAFSEKVKSYTGFSPLNYLINIRITEALKLLKRPDVHITDIAFKVGFHSSQHFATTFKKLTGYTPSEFRKSNTIKNN